MLLGKSRGLAWAHWMETQARTTWQGPALPKCLPHPRRSRQTTRVLPRLQQGPRWGGSPTSLCSVSPFEFEPHKGRATRTWQREQVSLQRAGDRPPALLARLPVTSEAAVFVLRVLSPFSHMKLLRSHVSSQFRLGKYSSTQYVVLAESYESEYGMSVTGAHPINSLVGKSE